MESLTRFGVAALLSLALAPVAAPCDPRSYDAKDDAPREQVCPPAEEPRRAATPAAVDGRRASPATQVSDVRLGGTGSARGGDHGPGAAGPKEPASAEEDLHEAPTAR
jgi:hypothetical protein